MPLRFDAAPAVVAAPSSPERRPRYFDARRASLRAAAPAVAAFDGLAFLRGGMTAAAPRSALARVVSAIRCPATVCLKTVRGGGDAGDVLIGRDLAQQFGQHGRITYVAAGDFDRPDLQRFLVNPEMDFAPDAALGTAMLARLSGKQSPGLFSDPPHSTRLHPRP